MFLLYFLDTYINMVKCLQKVLLDVSINWRYLYQDAGKTWMIWIGHNGTRYHNFNMLSQAFSYIFYQFSMVWELFATGYHALPSIFLKKY